MTAIDAINNIMLETDTRLSELSEYSDLGSPSNICQILIKKDLRVGVFVQMLETMGFQLVVQNMETDEEMIIDE